MFRDYSNYEVYEDGRIWSYKTKRFLKPQTMKNGYQMVSLSDNECKIKNYLLHRVIWESVTGSPIPDGLQVNHINEDKTDNRFFENLELVTPKQNCNFGTRNRRVAKALSKQVGAYKNNELVITFPSTQEAGRNGFKFSAVAACCRGERKTYKGYTWKYI